MTLMVVMVDEFAAEMAMFHLNQVRPFKRRLVRIELTPEQEAMLKPRCVGESQGRPAFEAMHDCWLEGEP